MRENVDLIAGAMMRFRNMARKMPPTFDKHGLAYPVNSPDQGLLGWLLPGRGYMSAVDLKDAGFRKRPPYVYEPDTFPEIETLMQLRSGRAGRGLRFRDTGRPKWADRFPHVPQAYNAISTYDGIISNRGGGKANDIAFAKASFTTVANQWSTLWHTGGQPSTGTYLATTAPTDAILTRADNGALSQTLSNPTSPDKKYLLTFGYGSTQQINMAILVDILNHSGAFRNTVNTAETIVTPTNATREYGAGTGIGNLVTLIGAVAGTGGAGTSTLQYVNQASANTNAPALTTAAVAYTADTILHTAMFTAGGAGFFIPLAAGDTGVRAIKQHTFSVAGTGASSAFAGNVFFPLSFVPGVAANAYIERDSTTQIDGVTELIQASNVIGHLAIYALPNGATSGLVAGFLRTVAG